VVITVLESTGAGYLGIHGAAPDPMPRLSRLSASALVFESAYCTYPESIKSLMAVLCSRYPALDVPAEAYAGLRTPALPEILGREGYAAALLHSGRFGYLGMDAVIGGRGFDVLEDAGAIGGERESSFGIDEASTVRRALAWIDSLPPERPFLLVYLPTAGHHPYAAAGPRPFPEREDRDAYLNDLHVADDALGRLLDGLEARGRSERTLIAVLGDHGEAFGQHPGNYGHSLALYEENVRVPFLIALPGLLDSPRRVAAPASTIDLAPTLLDLLGMAAPAAFQGASLLGSAPPRPALFFADYDRGLLGLRDREWKCIHELESGVTALFDLAQDPAETRDLATELPERVEDYVRGLKEWCAAQRRAIIVEARGP
jgi:arylsulfatase A-like enzyme